MKLGCRKSFQDNKAFMEVFETFVIRVVHGWTGGFKGLRKCFRRLS